MRLKNSEITRFIFGHSKGSSYAVYPAKKVTEFIQIGSDQAERHRMILVAPQEKIGIVYYRERIDNKFVFPRTGNIFILHRVVGYFPGGNSS